MIICPVRVEVPDYSTGKYSISDSAGFCVIDSAGNDVVLCQDRDAANTIANALNAVAEFPIMAVGSSWANTALIPWTNKFFPAYVIHHTAEMDCLCSECADT